MSRPKGLDFIVSDTPTIHGPPFTNLAMAYSATSLVISE